MHMNLKYTTLYISILTTNHRNVRQPKN